MIRLYTFNLSHFSEKARWALDYEGIAYEEKVLLPGPHQLTTRRIAKKTEVPVLEHDGTFVQGSSAILDYIADRLGGKRLAPSSSEARELEARADQAFGRGVQRVVYSVLLKPEHASKVVDLWVDNGPSWARTFYGFTFPVIASVVKRMYQTTKPELVAQAKNDFVALITKLDEQLARTPYLGGEQPSRLDISVAALLGPVCQPKEHHVKWPAIPPELADFEAQLKSHATWSHTLRMYRDHRRK